MQKLNQDIIATGLNSAYLVSENKMSPTQKQLKQYIIEHKQLPEELDVLIINSAYCTGWDLEDVSVQTYFYHAKTDHYNEEERYQSKNRIRHSIQFEFVYDAEEGLNFSQVKELILSKRRLALLETHLNVKLSAAQFKALCIELAFRNKKCEILKTKKSVEPFLEEIGFKVVSLHIKQGDIYIISR